MTINSVADDALPDKLNEVLHCSFFYDIQTQTPIQKILSKAIPSRCKIRSLVEITRNFCINQHDIYQFIKGMVICSLTGLYKQSNKNKSNKKIILETMNMMSKNDFLQWLRGKQQLLFFVLKEYLVYAIDFFPSMKTCLQKHYDWDTFASNVTTHMDQIRASSFIDENVENILQMAAKKSNSTTYIKRERKNSFFKILMNEAERMDDKNNIINEKQIIPKEVEQLIYEIIIRKQNKTPMFELLYSFKDIKNTSIAALEDIYFKYQQEQSKTNIKCFLKTLQRSEFELIKDFASAHDRKKYTRTYALPYHIAVAQIKAIRKKYDKETGQQLPKNAGTSLICTACKTFKGFIASKTTKHKKQTNTCAFGHSKVLVNLETLEMFCGRKIETTTSQKKGSQNKKKNEKKTIKDKRKEVRNKRCSQNKLTQVALLGQIIQFYNVLITICPFCGQTCKFDSKFFIGDKFYCGCCIEMNDRNEIIFQEKMCLYCGSRRHLEVIQTKPTEEHPNPSNYLCKKCHKMWIKTAQELLTVNIIKYGLSKKWSKLEF